MEGSPYLVTRGIVLRETVTRETDKILTLLTEHRGRTAVIARGARRRGCKFAASAQPLAFSEWTLYQKGGWYYANDGATIELFAGLREDLEAMALGFYFAELAEAVSVEEPPARPLLRHLLNGLYALSTLRKPPELVKPAFELRLLSLAGYEPLADACAVCGRTEPEEPCLDVVQGVLRCRNCGAAETAFPLCQSSLAALRHAVYGEDRRLYSFRLGGAALDRLSQAAEAFLTVQLERKFRTLEFYRSLRNADPRKASAVQESARTPPASGAPGTPQSAGTSGLSGGAGTSGLSGGAGTSDPPGGTGTSDQSEAADPAIVKADQS